MTKESRSDLGLALIAGFCGVLAAIATQYTSRALRKAPELAITALDPVKIESDHALSMILWNKSELLISVSRLDLDIFERGMPMTNGSKTTHGLRLAPPILTSIEKAADVASTPDETTTFQIECSFDTDDSGAWRLRLSSPVRGELGAGKSRVLSQVFPAVVEITTRGGDAISNFGVFEDYFDGAPPRAFRLGKFLENAGDVEVSADVEYGEGEKASRGSWLSFSRHGTPSERESQGQGTLLAVLVGGVGLWLVYTTWFVTLTYYPPAGKKIARTFSLLYRRARIADPDRDSEKENPEYVLRDVHYIRGMGAVLIIYSAYALFFLAALPPAWGVSFVLMACAIAIFPVWVTYSRPKGGRKSELAELVRAYPHLWLALTFLSGTYGAVGKSRLALISQDWILGIVAGACVTTVILAAVAKGPPPPQGTARVPTQWRLWVASICVVGTAASFFNILIAS